MKHIAQFLETTIQIERVLGNRKRQAALYTELSGYRLITSHYVLGEYLRTVIRDAIHLYEILLKYAHFDDVMTALSILGKQLYTPANTHGE
ncbi:MAG: hypothetical protein AAF639_04350 [Chloroflexota bacterium]